MNKTTFLSLIRQRGPVSDQDMEDLEKLVVNFPYCQSAHLLIAKAAYDKGSMLSNQKLRKAAIYATNRQLLKKLISTTAPVVPVQPVVETILISASPIPETSALVAEQEFLVHSGKENISAVPEPAPSEVSASGHENLENPAEVELNSTPESAPEAYTEPIVGNFPVDDLLNEDFIIPETDLDPELPVLETKDILAEALLPTSITAPEYAAELPDTILREETEMQPQALIAATEDVHFRETLANFDHYLFQPEKEEAEKPKDEIAAIFQQDTIGYWMASSRLGECLQLKDDLTRPQPYGFYPELILEYTKNNTLPETQKPVSGPLAEQLNIIDQFLKLTPKMKNITGRVRTEAQEDLSVKSSKINKNLASENFANILIQQGKIKKAIKIYEHLLLKIPEKKAYFVAQIEKLQNQA